MTGRMLGAALAVLLVFATTARADYEKACRATCRVAVQTTDGKQGIGTGVCIEATDQTITVQTNAHVVADAVSITCQFYQNGFAMEPQPGRVVAKVRNDLVDVGLIQIPVEGFQGNVPPVIPIAPRGYVVRQGEEIVSIGCAYGSWPTAFRGHCEGYEGSTMVFQPQPAQGRSGSAILDARCEQIVGILFAQSQPNSSERFGYACSLQALYNQLGVAKMQHPEYRLTQMIEAQCGPGGCPGGQCPAPQQIQVTPDRRYVMPYRRQQQKEPPPSPSVGIDVPTPYPGGIVNPPSAPPTDLSPVIGAINALGDRLSQPPAAAAPAGPDPQVVGALNTLGARADGHDAAINALGKKVDQVPDQIAAGIKPVSDQVAKVGAQVQDTNDLIAKNGNLKLRFAMAKEQYAEENPDANRLQQDVGALKGMVGDHSVIAKTVGVGLLLVFIAGLVHWLRTGHGLVAEAMKKAAEKHPDNEKLVEISAKLAAHEEALRAKLPIGHFAATAAAPLIGGAIGGPVGAAVGAAVPASEALVHALMAQIAALQAKQVDVAAATPAPGQATGAAPATTVNVAK